MTSLQIMPRGDHDLSPLGIAAAQQESVFRYVGITPLRQRMIDDMTARHFSEKAQKDYIRCVKNLAAFIGRPPETATAEDLRLYRLHLVQSPLGASSVNSYMTALRFFFSITLDRYELRKPLF